MHVADERYIFANESARYAEGKVAKGPAIKSNTATEIPDQTNLTASIEGARTWTCTNYEDAVLRQSAGLDTYRYFYGGEWRVDYALLLVQFVR